MESPKELEAFSIVKRAKSFSYAIRGIKIFFKTQHNAWLHIFATLIVIILGIYFSITLIEWALLVFAIGLVFVTEALNTAMEFDMDLTSPEFHPFARDTKDIAAGAVLISAITAVIIGGIIFIPKIIQFLN